jgi:perosamine synthetase
MSHRPAASPTLPSDQDASGRTLGEEEIQALAEAVRSGTLTSTKGRFVKAFEEAFARKLGVRFAHACSSGTAAVHLAVAALDPEPGDEFVTSPITDMGALTPILYQGAIPVFADVDPDTCNVTARTIEARLSDKTKAIVVTHLFGNPCEMDDILALARSRGLPVIEDCAQAFGATWQSRPLGTLGTIACFSLQQGKHITTGEGGLLATDDPDLARRAYLFINKAWGYGDERPDHYFLALNYRMSELQGAVALAQLAKLDEVVERRGAMAERLTRQLVGCPGLGLPKVHAAARHSYWKFAVTIDEQVIPGGPAAVAAALKGLNIPSAPRYIQKPAFECAVIRDQRTFGNSRWPFSLARVEALDYSKHRFPGVYRGLEQILVLPWNERLREEHVDHLAAGLRSCLAGSAVEELAR